MNCRRPSHKSFERILLIKPSAVGDVIHTLPVLAKLRRRYPAARIDWLLTPAIAELVGHHPALSNVVALRPAPLPAPVAGLVGGRWPGRALSRPYANRAYDLVIDLHGQFRSAVLTLATGAAGADRVRPAAAIIARAADRCRRRLIGTAGRGPAKGPGWRTRTTSAFRRSTFTPRTGTCWSASMLGFDDGPPSFDVPIPASRGSPDRAVAGRQHGRLGRPLAVLVPGTLWETKHWHVEGFAEVARHLLGAGRAVVLAGANAERPRCREVAERCPGVVRPCRAKRRSPDLAALIRRAAICVTNDSGSMHLTVALDRPVVSIFGPTDPVWIGPYRRPMPSSGPTCRVRPATCGSFAVVRHEHVCMTRVTAEDGDQADRARRCGGTAVGLRRPGFVQFVVPAGTKPHDPTAATATAGVPVQSGDRSARTAAGRGR